MTDAIRKALDDFDAAAKKLGKVNGKAGAGSEAAYAQAYQRLVQLGVKPQLRGKYRV